MFAVIILIIEIICSFWVVDVPFYFLVVFHRVPIVITVAAVAVTSGLFVRGERSDSEYNRLATLFHRGVRPFGVSLLMAGFDDEGPQLYQVDPSGSYFAWKASAIGKHAVSAKDFLEKRCVLCREIEAIFSAADDRQCIGGGAYVSSFAGIIPKWNWKMPFIRQF